METVRKQELYFLTTELKKTFAYNPIDDLLLEKLFHDKNYAGMVDQMRRHMKIVCGLSLKCIATRPDNKGAPAWVISPPYFPPYGSQLQKNMKIEIFFYKEALNSYYKFIVMMAHELSHIVLKSIDHALKRNEEAVDITAIILGFGKYYELGHTTFNENGCLETGYLHFDELMYVLSIVDNISLDETYELKANNTNWFKKIFKL